MVVTTIATCVSAVARTYVSVSVAFLVAVDGVDSVLVVIVEGGVAAINVIDLVATSASIASIVLLWRMTVLQLVVRKPLRLVARLLLLRWTMVLPMRPILDLRP